MNLKAIAICFFIVLYCFNVKAQEANRRNVDSLVRDTISLSADTVSGVPLFFGDQAEPNDTTRKSTVGATVSMLSAADTIQVKREPIKKIVKGYSPFTNYTDTFNVGIPDIDTATTPIVNKQLKKHLAKLKDTSKTQTTGRYFHEKKVSYSKTSLTDLWYNYINATYSHTDSDTVQKLIVEKFDDIGKVKIKENPELLQEHDNKSAQTKYITSIPESSNSNTASAKEATNESNVVFYIQIAAARSKLSSAEIKKINKTHAEYRVINENDWFKYQVSLGSNYISARQAINEYPSKHVFLVAYRGNKRLDLWETVKHIELQTPKQNELLFVVQVAASRQPLSIKEKSQLIASGDNLRSIQEDGWYKYQIIIGSSYQLTLNKCKLIGINKSFPVAYLNGVKIDMAKAIKMTITNN